MSSPNHAIAETGLLSSPASAVPRDGGERPRLDPARDSASGLRTFFEIMRAWDACATSAIALLGVPRTTYYKWKRKPESARLGRDQFERLSYIFGIYKALQILFPTSENADGWVRRANNAPLFGGYTPLEVMGHGQVADLYRVRQYLDAERGW